MEAAGLVAGGLICLWAQGAGATSINVSDTCTLQEAVTSVDRAVFNPSPPPPPEPGCAFASDGQTAYTINVPSGTTPVTAEILVRVSMTIAGAGTTATTLATSPAVAFRVEGSPRPNPTLTLRTLTLRKSIFTNDPTSGVLVNGLPGPAHLALDRVRLANYTRDGIVLQGSPPDFTVDVAVVDSTIETNTLAGILSNDGGIFVSGSTINGNLGGGIRGTFTDPLLAIEVTNSTISNNRGPDGAGIFMSLLGDYEPGAAPQLVVVGTSLTGNQATGDGGGAFASGAVALFERVVATNNTAVGDGGAICVESRNNEALLTIVEASMTNNRAVNGGAVALVQNNDLTALGTIERSLFANNTATGDGGGVYSGYQFGTLNNSTFTDNTATRGGGFFHGPFGGESHMSRCTVANNSASQVGGGVYMVVNNPVFSGNLVALNNAPSSPDINLVEVTAVIGGNNLIGNNQGATVGLPNGVDGNIAGSPGSPVNPLLGSLANLGGPTQVRPLMTGSPAINAIPLDTFNVENIDQRGFPRPQGSGYDMGAFELGVTSNATIFGFESATSWTSPVPLTLDSVRKTQGSFGLAVGGSNYRLVTGAPLTTPLTTPTARLLLDVFIPGNQPNPFWLGAVQVYASCPSVALNNEYVGQVELTGKPTNAFSTLTFTVPAIVRTAFGQSHTDCFLSIAVNTNATPTTPVLDNLRFGP